MSKTPNYDAKVKKILEEIKPEPRTCELTGEKWTMTEEEIGWYRKFNVPSSNLAPLTRMRQIMSFFVGYEFWYQKHPETGKQIVSLIHPSSGIKVLPDKEWFEKDFSSINLAYNSNSDFFEQLLGLYHKVPVNASRNLIEPINSIALASFGDRDSYFVLACESERSFYSSDSNSEDSAEIYSSSDVQNSYNVTMSKRVFNSQFVKVSLNIMDSAFIFYSRDCEFCFGATNKRNAKYIWFDKQISKEEWEKRRARIDLSCRSTLEKYKKQFHDLMRNTVWPENFNANVTNCTGEYLYRSSNLHNCYFAVDNSNNQYYTAFSYQGSADSAFSAVFSISNHLYETWFASKSANCKFCLAISGCDGLEYSINCFNSTHCFGCVGLNRKSFCIFNKQYTEEEYWKKLDEIKSNMLDRGEYGKFFPLNFSHCYVLSSGAVLVYMSEKEDLEKLGAVFFDAESNGAIGKELMDKSKMRSAEDVPDCIQKMTNDWIGVPLFDKQEGRRFAYLKPEIEFYKNHKLAAPNNHFTARIKNLFLEMNSAIYEEINCGKCNKKIKVAINRVFPKKKVYCIECYNQYLQETT